MKLTEWEGKELLRASGIATPQGERIEKGHTTTTISFPLVLKSQVLAGDRKLKGGVLVVASKDEFEKSVDMLFTTLIDGCLPNYLLAEEFIVFTEELYVSFSYTSEFRTPVLSLNHMGGSGVHEATLTSINVLKTFGETEITQALARAKIATTQLLVVTVENLWKLFQQEKLRLLEINPLFVQQGGNVLAGDAKIVRDDALLLPVEKPILQLGGDIAIIASGGGASMLNIDILMRAGGKPANYVEYSGNPPASVVEELTVRVLQEKKVRGVWVVGGTANFTDLFETLSGFVAGLRRITPKPLYPIVIRRDGPRLAEAREMLARVAVEEGYQLYVYGPETSMAQSAEVLLQKIHTV